MNEIPKKKFSFQFNTQTLVFIVLIALWTFLSITSSHFFNINNIRNLFSQEAIVGVLAVGQLYTIITAGIDLSVGTVAALTNVVLTLLVINGVPIPLAIILTLLLATGFGVANGAIIYELNMPPFIVTLGTMSIAAGAALLISGGTNISGLPISFSSFGSGIFLGMPNLFWLLIIAVVGGEIVLRFSRFGKYVYAVGSSVEAARLSGVNVRKVIYGVYILSGFLAGVGGVMLTARLWMGVPTAGADYNLNSIAAAAIGGASLFGAQGTVIGAFLGAIVMSTIYNGTVLLNVNPFWQEIIVGVLIIGTVALDQIKKRQKYTYTKK
ncbi:MAG: ABC transporter permease [Thermotogae bacterium]|jgi:ribose transport system permease protein|nr:ABC transporter permease [Thermotogota bacterium]MCL5032207.1 ABC transporter permease [Thermotogota bacterium]